MSTSGIWKTRIKNISVEKRMRIFHQNFNLFLQRPLWKDFQSSSSKMHELVSTLILWAVLRIRIRDPVPFRSLDPGFGMGKNSGSRSGMNNPNHIYESIETIFWVKILKFFDADPGSGIKKFGSGMKKIGFVIWDKYLGSVTLPVGYKTFPGSYLDSGSRT